MGTALILRNLPRPYVPITLLYSYVKTPYPPQTPNLGNNYLLNVKNRNTRKRPDIYSQLTINIHSQEDVMEVDLVFSLLTLNFFTPFPSFLVIDFEQVNICWENYLTFYLFDRQAGLNKKQCREFRYLSCFTHSVRCNLANLQLLK